MGRLNSYLLFFDVAVNTLPESQWIDWSSFYSMKHTYLSVVKAK